MRWTGSERILFRLQNDLHVHPTLSFLHAIHVSTQRPQPTRRFPKTQQNGQGWPRPKKAETEPGFQSKPWPHVSALATRQLHGKNSNLTKFRKDVFPVDVRHPLVDRRVMNRCNPSGRTTQLKTLRKQLCEDESKEIGEGGFVELHGWMPQRLNPQRHMRKAETEDICVAKSADMNGWVLQRNERPEKLSSEGMLKAEAVEQDTEIRTVDVTAREMRREARLRQRAREKIEQQQKKEFLTTQSELNRAKMVETFKAEGLQDFLFFTHSQDTLIAKAHSAIVAQDGTITLPQGRWAKRRAKLILRELNAIRKKLGGDKAKPAEVEARLKAWVEKRDKQSFARMERKTSWQRQEIRRKMERQVAKKAAKKKLGIMEEELGRKPTKQET